MNTDKFKGRPVAPDVELLMNSINAAPGETVSLETCAVLLRLDLKKLEDRNRLRTVVTRYRRELLATRRIDTRGGGGQIRFLTAVECYREGGRALGRHVRSIGRTGKRIDQGCDPRQLPTEDDKKAHGLLARELQALKEAGQKAIKAAAVPDDVKAMPRLRVVGTEAP